MTPLQLREWRASHNWSRREAAEALGVSPSRLFDYEAGRQRGSGHSAPIPRYIALACIALRHAPHMRDYEGE